MDPPTPPDRANHSPLTYYPPDRSQPARNAFGFVETVLNTAVTSREELLQEVLDLVNASVGHAKKSPAGVA